MKAKYVRFSAPAMGALVTMAVLFAAATRSTLAAAPAAEPQTMKGSVERFNYNPKGEYESLLLSSDGKSVQINFTPHLSADIAKAVAIGDSITVIAKPTDSKGDHPVFDFTSITPKSGDAIVAPQPKPKPDHPDAHAAAETVEGVIKYLNYAHHAEVNGVVLASGDFVHLGPDGSKAPQIAVGQQFKAEGSVATTADGHKVMEHPTKVNGADVHHGPPDKKDAPKPGRGA